MAFAPMADYRNTLFLPFEKGLLTAPKDGQAGVRNWTLLNAKFPSNTSTDWSKILTCEQGFRTDYLELSEQGFKVEPSLTTLKNQDGVMIFAARSRHVNEANLIRAWNGTKPGGVIMFAGQKTSGVQPLRKWAGKRTEIHGSLSKHHAVVFWLVRDGKDWVEQPTDLLVDGYHIAAGMFSASGPDKGSKLLAEYIAAMPHGGLRGRVADFGAGWGFLSAEIQKSTDNIDSLELYEADWESLEAAKFNVGEKADYHWCDITKEAPKGPYNWIVMNPPFHTGRAAEPSLGNIFIEAAAKALPQGGSLLLVANTNLPYEKTLEKFFKKVERRAQANGFKIIQAVR